MRESGSHYGCDRSRRANVRNDHFLFVIYLSQTISATSSTAWVSMTKKLSPSPAPTLLAAAIPTVLALMAPGPRRQRSSPTTIISSS
ncbi:hypothetical protein BC938DRAFT_476642 [Jimgerdemannia flammicorona]|uniref:Uncharacterized protein n=1 Tax=Jimgerdemannia flammicorona TaxID=994334 RepID=A0A433QQ96_9FUNG|nr:hypothetical protein BC938DRAFT_476642 [Jimgerdemannia flammicorona]